MKQSTRKPAETVDESRARRMSAVLAGLRRAGIAANLNLNSTSPCFELGLDAAERAVAQLDDARCMWRVTRRQPYLGAIGENDPSARSAYYVNASTAEAAARFMHETLFPTDTAGFTVQSFAHAGEGAHGEIVGTFFDEGDHE